MFKNKKEQFKIWLKTFNSQYDCNIQFIDRLVKPSLNTAWLSGFLYAVGCFTGRVKACHTSNLNKVPFLTFAARPNKLKIYTFYIYYICHPGWRSQPGPGGYKTVRARPPVGVRTVFRRRILYFVKDKRYFIKWSD
jgi:hypothetical protein